jgi:hypothetical protein
MKMTTCWDIAPCSLMTDVVLTSETSVYFIETTRHYIPGICPLKEVRWPQTVGVMDGLFLISIEMFSCSLRCEEDAGPYYPLGTIGTVSRA